MNRWQRRLGRIILLSFALRALVPMGLMLQLPLASADATDSSVSASGYDTDITSAATAAAKPTGSSLGFVICPVQNPGIDLGVLVDRGQVRDPHSHHQHHHSNATGDDLKDGDSNTLSVDRGAPLCHLWSSSGDNSLLTVEITDTDFGSGLLSALAPAVNLYLANQFPQQLTRAPPQTL